MAARKIDGQHKSCGWNCTFSRVNFTETKILLRPAWRDFPIGCMTTCSVTWPGHVTKRGMNTQSSAKIFSGQLPVTCLFSRCETLIHFTSNWCWKRSSFFFEWAKMLLFHICLTSKVFKGFFASKIVLANIQLQLNEIIFRHLQNVL